MQDVLPISREALTADVAAFAAKYIPAAVAAATKDDVDALVRVAVLRFVGQFQGSDAPDEFLFRTVDDAFRRRVESWLEVECRGLLHARLRVVLEQWLTQQLDGGAVTRAKTDALRAALANIDGSAIANSVDGKRAAAYRMWKRGSSWSEIADHLKAAEAEAKKIVKQAERHVAKLRRALKVYTG